MRKQWRSFETYLDRLAADESQSTFNQSVQPGYVSSISKGYKVFFVVDELAICFHQRLMIFKEGHNASVISFVRLGHIGQCLGLLKDPSCENSASGLALLF